MKKINLFIIPFILLLVLNGNAFGSYYIFITSPYIPHENWFLGSSQVIEWEEHTQGDTVGGFRILLKQNGQEVCVIKSNYKKLDAIPVSGFSLMDDGFRWKYQWNKAGYCENNSVVESGTYQIGLQSIDPTVPGTHVSPPFTIYVAQKVPESNKKATTPPHMQLPKESNSLAKSPEYTAKETVFSQIASQPILKKNKPDKAYAPPKITMPYHGQLIFGPVTDGKTPFPYRVAFAEQVDLTVSFEQYKLPEGIYPVDYEPKPTGTWHTVLEKTIPASHLTVDEVYGYYAFTEQLYMESGKRYRVKAKAHFSQTNSTGWGQAVPFSLNCNVGKIADANLTPTQLSLRQNRKNQCELWIEIRNIGKYRYNKPLQWEVFKDGKWVGTWGSGNDSINIGPWNEQDNTVERRAANPAAFAISPYGIHKYQIKLLPDWNEEDKINNISSSYTLQCKTLKLQPGNTKELGTSDKTLSPQTRIISVQTNKKFYSSGEHILFTLPTNPRQQPIVECFNNKRWSRRCPAGTMLRKTGQGKPLKYALKAPQSGQYRIRLGTAVSKVVIVRGGQKQPSSTRSAKQQLKTPPSISLNQNVFTAPAKVNLKVKTIAGVKVSYVLEQKTSGRYRKIKTLRSLNFTVSKPGFYRVKASYGGSKLEAVKSFEVKEAKIKRVQNTRKIQKTESTRHRQPSR